jgi:hypothetical protein
VKLTKYHCELKWKIEDYNDPSSWATIEAQTPKQAAEAFTKQYWFQYPNMDWQWFSGFHAIGVKPVDRTTWQFFDVKVTQPVFKAAERRDYVQKPPAIETHS